MSARSSMPLRASGKALVGERTDRCRIVCDRSAARMGAHRITQCSMERSRSSGHEHVERLASPARIVGKASHLPAQGRSFADTCAQIPILALRSEPSFRRTQP